MAGRKLILLSLILEFFLAPVATVKTITPHLRKANHACGIFPLDDSLRDAHQRSIEVLKIINSSTPPDFGHQSALLEHLHVDWSDSYLSDEDGISKDILSTSMIDVAKPRVKDYTLETEKTAGFFSHKIRGHFESQLVVITTGPEMLLNALKLGPGKFVQTERSYWNTFSRIVLHFTESYDEDSMYV